MEMNMFNNVLQRLWPVNEMNKAKLGTIELYEGGIVSCATSTVKLRKGVSPGMIISKISHSEAATGSFELMGDESKYLASVEGSHKNLPLLGKEVTCLSCKKTHIISERSFKEIVMIYMSCQGSVSGAPYGCQYLLLCPHCDNNHLMFGFQLAGMGYVPRPSEFRDDISKIMLNTSTNLANAYNPAFSFEDRVYLKAAISVTAFGADMFYRYYSKYYTKDKFKIILQKLDPETHHQLVKNYLGLLRSNCFVQERPSLMFLRAISLELSNTLLNTEYANESLEGTAYPALIELVKHIELRLTLDAKNYVFFPGLYALYCITKVGHLDFSSYGNNQHRAKQLLENPNLLDIDDFVTEIVPYLSRAYVKGLPVQGEKLPAQSKRVPHMSLTEAFERIFGIHCGFINDTEEHGKRDVKLKPRY